MFLEDIGLVFMQPCTQPGGNVLFKAKFTNDIAEVLPYINSTIKEASYNHKSKSLTYKRGYTLITLRSETLYVCKALNETDAYEIIDAVKNLINSTYDDKDNIEPDYEMKKKPTALEIFKYLPKINCGKCKEATCIAFASKIIIGSQKLKNCDVLEEKEYENSSNELKDIVQMLGYE